MKMQLRKTEKSLKRNYLYNLSYQILLLFTPLITTPYISRVLGADGIGRVSYTESIATYFVLFATMGITTYGQREISYVQDNRHKRSIVFWNTKILEFTTSIVALIAYLILSANQEDQSIFIIFSINILAVFFDVTWLFQGLEEFGKIVLRNIFFKALNIIYIFLYVKNATDVVGYAFGLCFFTLISNISLWLYLPKYVDRVSLIRLNPFKDFPIVVSLFIPTIAISIYTVLDKTMIGIITKSSLENGYYEQALKISRMVLTLVTSLGTVMIPRIGFNFENGKTDEVKRLMYNSYRFVWFLGTPLCLGLFMVSSNFVPWFYGDGYDKVTNLLRILALLILAIGINNVTGIQFLIPTKRQNIFTLTVIIGACVNFIMNYILIKSYQSIGAAIASVTAETVIAVIQLVMIRDQINPVRVLKEGINYFIAGLFMSIGLFFLDKRFVPSILHTIILIVLGVIIYFSILIILRDEFLFSNVKNVRKTIHEKLENII